MRCSSVTGCSPPPAYALLGTALNAVPYLLVNVIGRRVKGSDQKATWKLIPALIAP